MLLTLQEIKLTYIKMVLDKSESRKEAAKILGVSERSIRHYVSVMKEDGIIANEEAIKEILEFRFATNEERIKYLDTRKRVR